MELSVGLMLMLLGILNIFGFRRSVRESIHLQEDSGSSHSNSLNSESHASFDHAGQSSKHIHGISLEILDRMCANLTIYQMCRPLLIGIVHGLAGSAAVALLVLTTIHNSRWAVAYLASSFTLYPLRCNLYLIEEVFDRFSLWNTWRLRRRWILGESGRGCMGKRLRLPFGKETTRAQRVLFLHAELRTLLSVHVF